MLLTSLALLTLAGPALPDEPKATVVVDSSKHEVAVTVGPFHVAAMPEGMKHEDMEMMDDHNSPLIRFDWPVDGWLRGFSVDIVDGQGRPVDRKLIHHMIGVNFDRRQLLYPAVERLFGIGQETEDMYVPKTIGVPMKDGFHLGMYMAWANETGKDLDGVMVRVRFAYSPPNLNPRPVNALPIYMDVNLTVGGTNTFDVPPGISEKSYEFTMPIEGRLLGYGGHLHDYGLDVRLQDVESGKILATVKAVRTKTGKVTRITRSLPGVSGDGILLKAGHKYRVIGRYDNPTGQTLVKGAMAHLTGLFAPSDFAQWPALDLSDATLQEDLASLNEMGGHSMEHQH